jgi:5-methylcytosine-specific restriction protein A
MANRPARPCSAGGCPNLVTKAGRWFCDEHLRERQRAESAERRRDGRHADYGPSWRMISARFLQANPFCACGARAVLVHHVVERRDGGTDAYGNLMAMCRSCHSRLHARQRGGVGEKK